jgi:RNA polymerase sigma-70 factor, ECF subfamily
LEPTSTTTTLRHPALARDAQVALTLRLVCGLSTAEVARAFPVREPAMAARITRAKKKISGPGSLPDAVP